MPTINELENETGLVENLHEIVQTYEEIYVAKMQRVRDSVLKTRQYIDGLAGMFQELRAIYRHKLLSRKKDTDVNSISFSTLNKNGKRTKVLLTSNQRLSGDIDQKVFTMFLEDIKSEQGDFDIAIVGRIGKEMFEQRKLPYKYKYFPFSGDTISQEKFKPLVNHLINYERVDIFFGKFVNLLQQTQTKSNLSGEDLSTSTSQARTPKEYDDHPSFLFEPSLEEILNFFETQVFSALLHQTFDESRLAQIGSRITAMEEASGNIQDHLKDLRFKKNRLTKREKNKKQLQRLAGISLWQGK